MLFKNKVLSALTIGILSTTLISQSMADPIWDKFKKCNQQSGAKCKAWGQNTEAYKICKEKKDLSIHNACALACFKARGDHAKVGERCPAIQLQQPKKSG